MKNPLLVKVSDVQMGRQISLCYFTKLLSGFKEFNQIEFDYYKQFLTKKELRIISKLPNSREIKE